MPTFTPKQAEALLNAKAKGFVTQVTNKATSLIRKYTRNNLYNVPTLLRSGKIGHPYYDRSRALLGSVVATRTDFDGESWGAEAGFDVDRMEQYATEPKFETTKSGKTKMVKFGTFTNIQGDFVGDELLDDDWIEDGTFGGKAPRKGAHILQDTIDELNDYFESNDIEADISKLFGGKVTVQRG